MVNLYRKYRPKKFSELIGQSEIKEILISELKNKKVSHAYLFTGMRGCGKTTTARLLAKALNCTNLQNGFEPCDECDNCKAIDSASFPDVIEMDAASNRGIDEIRSIKEGVNFVPAIGKYKVYIIDEVHMLTQQAFNALLKTLEEPPEHTVFILATTEINKVPQTIISRCQVLSFKPHDLEDVIKNLITISEKEGFTFERDALEIIAKKGEGSMRDSIGILEQVSIFSRGNLTKQYVLELLGDVEDELLDNFIDSILSRDRAACEEILENVYMSGKNMEIFLKDLIYRLNERIKNGDTLYKMLTFFVNAYKDMLYFFDKKIFVTAKTFELIDSMYNQSHSVESGNFDKESISNKHNFENKYKSDYNQADIFKNTDQTIDDQSIVQTEKSEFEIEKKDSISSITETDSQTNENDNLPEYWKSLMQTLKDKNITLYTVISKAVPEFYNDRVVLKYPNDEGFSYETVSSKIEDINSILKKYGFDRRIIAIKGEENIDELSDEIKNILKLFGGSIEKK